MNSRIRAITLSLSILAVSYTTPAFGPWQCTDPIELLTYLSEMDSSYGEEARLLLEHGVVTPPCVSYQIFSQEKSELDLGPNLHASGRPSLETRQLDRIYQHAITRGKAAYPCEGEGQAATVHIAAEPGPGGFGYLTEMSWISPSTYQLRLVEHLSQHQMIESRWEIQMLGREDGNLESLELTRMGMNPEGDQNYVIQWNPQLQPQLHRLW